MSGNRHDRAGAVLAEHEVRHPDWNGLASERVHRAYAGIEALLLDVPADSGGAILGPESLCLPAESRWIRGPFGKRGHERMLRTEEHEGGPEDRVDACREHLDLRPGIAFDRELHARAFRPPDPVALHRQDLLGPLRQGNRVVEELVGVRRDAEEPLLQIARLNHRPAAPTRAIDDLFVRQDRVAARTPVHRRSLAIRQASLEHSDEKPLIPCVVIGIARGELTFPRVADAQPLQLTFHVRDVPARRDLRVQAVLDGGVFRGQTEGVPAERVQHVEAAHPLHARHDIADRVVSDVPEMSVTGGVRKHVQAIELRSGRIDGHFERAGGGPTLLPLPVEVLRMVVGHLLRTVDRPDFERA